jgi:predicted DNA-binding protein (MmcQ/YjbR family)
VKSEEDPLDPSPVREWRAMVAAIRHLEQAVLGAEWTEGIVLRYGALYGPGTSMAPGEEPFEMIRKRKFPIVGDGGGVWSAVEEFPFDPETPVFKVGGKMFALTAIDKRPLTVSLKCEPSLAEALRAEHSAVRPGYHLNKRHWITLDDSLPDELVLGLLEDSYELLVDGLPKRERDLVRSRAP